MASLHVRNLHRDVTEEMLLDKFSSSSHVLYIRIYRSMITKLSLGYALVDFRLKEEAEKAMKTLNLLDIKGQPMHITWSQQDPSVRKSQGDILVRNIGLEVDDLTLYDCFKFFGKIVYCHIMRDTAQGSKGYGFVHFEKDEDAFKSIEKLNGMLLDDKKMECILMSGNKAEENFNNIYVKNLTDDCDDDMLRDMFEPYGKIISAKAVSRLNGVEIGGKILYCGRFENKAERHVKQLEKKRERSGVNVFVKNLDEEIDDERLRKEFSQFGIITSAKVMRNGDKSKGFGFVSFSSPVEAAKAIREMNGLIVISKPLYVALHQPKEDRRRQLQEERIAEFKKKSQQWIVPGQDHLTANMPAAACAFPPFPMLRYPAVSIPGVRPAVNPAGWQGMFAQPRVMQQSQQSVVVPGQDPLTATMLAAAPAKEQKQMLGERLFPFIQQMHPNPDLAGKITDMLLEIDNLELLHMLQSPKSLKLKVDEAVAVWQTHQVKKQ